MATRDIIESGVSLLGGIGIGAALMYLFDPESGPTRRGYWRDYAADGLESAAESLHGAKDVAASTLSDSLEGANSLGSSTLSRIRDYLPFRRESTLQRAQRILASAAHRGREMLPERPSVRLSVATTALTCCAVGAVAMFLLDPQAGRRRRALIRDKAYSTARRSAEAVTREAKHLSNVSRGMVHEAGHMVTGHGHEPGSQHHSA